MSSWSQKVLRTTTGVFAMGFCVGAMFELFRIKWTPFGINFYDVARKKYKQRSLNDLRQRLDAALLEQRSEDD